MSTEISFIINLHREGRLCVPTLETAMHSVCIANKMNLTAELILVADNPDRDTLHIASQAAPSARIEITNVCDLGDARNFGISVSRGRYVAFMDGDDLCCDSWLARAFMEITANEQECIVHPKFNLFFGRNYDRYFWVHPDCRDDKIRLSKLIAENLWTSSVFGSRDTFLRFPYRRNKIGEGIGYEDWVFNIETAIAGIRHIVAQDTILFIRRNKQYSLLEESNSGSVMPDISRLFAGKISASEILTRTL